MRLQHLKQIGDGLAADDSARAAAKAVIVTEVERLHWRIWNGKAKDARRMNKSQQMRWSRRGADLLLHVRRAVYNGTFCAEFGQKFHPANDSFPPTAVAAYPRFCTSPGWPNAPRSSRLTPRVHLPRPAPPSLGWMRPAGVATGHPERPLCGSVPVAQSRSSCSRTTPSAALRLPGFRQPPLPTRWSS